MEGKRERDLVFSIHQVVQLQRLLAPSVWEPSGTVLSSPSSSPDIFVTPKRQTDTSSTQTKLKAIKQKPELQLVQYKENISSEYIHVGFHTRGTDRKSSVTDVCVP